ncbi:hypothetical protein CHS0354_010053 [Potamilus streckersoni]|uniref:Uncharacterized protein n=1 Tax=Potamilus streckersoni TaxID=2493646 RepID=A0AAE0VU97_9BIVA|nr:hypothetical protein CHS0354_010053 [Potamilus streckersoni]
MRVQELVCRYRDEDTRIAVYRYRDEDSRIASLRFTFIAFQFGTKRIQESVSVQYGYKNSVYRYQIQISVSTANVQLQFIVKLFTILQISVIG